eukprot:gene6552-7852_t
MRAGVVLACFRAAVAEDEEGEYGGIPYTGIDPEQLREAEDRVQKLEMQLDEMQSALTSKTVHSSQIQKENEELKEHIKLFEEQKLELTAELDTVKSEPTGGMYSLQDAEDVVIVSNHIGRNMAEQLQKYLHRSCAGWATGVVNCSTHGLEEVERRAVCARVAVVVVLSLGALQDAGCVLALALSEAETHYGYPHNQRILIIHQVLQRKFVVWLEPGDMDLVEGGREAHYRKLIYRTKQAHTLLVYLTFGFLESQACMLQLITAVAHAMHIVWARDFMFQLPDDVDMEGSAVHALLQRILAEHSGEFLDHADLEMRVLEVLRSNSGSCLIFHPDLFDPFMLRLARRARCTRFLFSAACEVEGFPFPPYEQLPKAPSGEVVKAFDQPAVPYISMHSETGFKQITHRLCDRGAASAAPGSPREVLAESGRGGQLPSKALPELGESAFAAYAVLQEVVPPVHLQMCQKKTRVMWSFKHASAQRDVNRLHQ